MPNRRSTLDQLPTRPTYLTTLGSRYPDGRCRSSMDGTVWLYRSVPLAPVVDARDNDSQLAAMEPLFRAYQELASMVGASSNRRFVARSSYRRTHALLVNIPRFFHLPWTHPIAGYLNRAHGHEPVDRRLLMFGVQLKDSVGGGGGWRDRIDSVAAFLADRQVPLADFDEDFGRVDAALVRAGLAVPKPEEWKLADAYWNRGDTPATPTLNHLEHIHVFHDPESMRLAEMLGTDNCDALEAVPGQGAVTYASVTEFDLDFDAPTSPSALWASDLIESDAIAVSIRGLVEPAKITRDELRRQRRRFITDIQERHKQGKMSRAEQDEMLANLTVIEDHYAKGGANPTLVDTSILVAFAGIKDLDRLNTSDRQLAKLAPMTLTQPGAMAETWLCSTISANPKLHDLPIQVVAASGITSLSFVGDRDGALFGLTERDRQPALLSPTAASTADGLPIFLCAAATGAGKTMLMLNLADQWARMGYSGVIIDPKQGSDHSLAVRASGGQVIRLDDVLEADGIFDPIRFSAKADVGVELAASMLLSVNVWGAAKADYEQPLEEALKHGVEQGATCIGEALTIARDDLGDQLPADLVHKVLAQAKASPTFSALVGTNPRSRSLAVAEGITLIMVGDSHLNIPLPGHTPDSLGQRAALALIRMMVFGSASALAGRGGGFIELDEAWTFLDGGAGEMDRLGRVARSQQVLPCLFTQRVTDALNARLEGYISRLAIGPITDPDEARAACQLAKLDPAKYLERITTPGTVGGTSQSGETPNWKSMRALRDPVTREVLRGAVFLYKDLHERAIPVEVTLPAEFLARASTNPAEIAARRVPVEDA